MARYKTLLSQEAIPQQQPDTQVATVRQYEGSVKADQGAVNNARLQLSYARITSPIPGRVGLRLVNPGNIVHASDQTGLLVITQVNPIAVLFTIPEDSLPAVLAKLRAGAQLTVDAYNRDRSQKIASGKLLTVDNQIDPNTGTSRLKAVFENGDRALFPNQFVNVRLLVEMRHGQVIVPSAAIHWGAQGTFAYVIKGDTVEVRQITAGIVEGNDASIDNGLNAGEKVVIEGSDRLQPGVRIAERGPGAGKRQEQPSGGPAE